MKPTLFFLDGVAPTHNSLVLAAQYNQYADVDASRVLMKFGDVWSKVDFDEDVIRSLAFRASTGTLYLLSNSGAVYTIGGREVAFTRDSIRKTLKKQQVVDIEDRGELTRVRVAKDRVFVCGLGGQVLEQKDGVWQSIGLQGQAPICPDFEDITVGANDVPLAVGSQGAVYTFPATGPERMESPTNQYLSSVVTDSAGQCYACGNRGVVLRMGETGIIDISVDMEPYRNLWSIAFHDGLLFVCEPDRLLVRGPSMTSWGVEVVSPTPHVTFNRLMVQGSSLWSFGADHVFVKHADSWEHVQIPGNEIPL